MSLGQNSDIRGAVSGARDGQVRDLHGAGGGTRTHDLLITNQLLCH